MYLYLALFVALSIGLYAVRHLRAKGAAHQWLQQHHYRVRSFKVPWLTNATFASSWLRNSDRAVTFEAEVDDTRLGGTGKVLLRVWTNWAGDITDDVEVVWKEMPDADIASASRPLFDRLADAQLSVLRRITAGETTFYAPRRRQTGMQSFDEVVEHAQALQRRGMIVAGEPRIDGRNGNRYSSIGDLAATEEGRRWLESQGG